MIGYIPQSSRTYFFVRGETPLREHQAPFIAGIQAIYESGQIINSQAFYSRYGVASVDLFSWSRSVNNENRWIAVETLKWLYPGLGEPSAQEVTDFQATGDQRYWDYMRAFLYGFSPDRPLHVTRTDVAHGPFSAYDNYWRMTLFYYNDAGLTTSPPPPPPPPTEPPSPPPTTGLSSPEQRAEELASLVRPIWNAVVFNAPVVNWDALWPKAKPLAVELISSFRRWMGRIKA